MNRRISVLLAVCDLILGVAEGIYWIGWVGLNHLNPLGVISQSPYITFLDLQYYIIISGIILYILALYFNGWKPPFGRQKN